MIHWPTLQLYSATVQIVTSAALWVAALWSCALGWWLMRRMVRG